MFDLNSENTSLSRIDELDIRLIEQLRLDARDSVRAIARVLGVSRETVRYRLNRLISEEILKIVCVTQVERLGYQFTVVIGVRTRPGCTASVAEQLAGLPGVVDVSLTGNHYNLLVWAVLRDRHELESFMLNELIKVPNMICIEVMHTFHVFKDFWHVLGDNTKDASSSAQKPLSDFDLAIIKAMQLDPMQTITELAISLKCSRPVARTALERLIKEGSLGFIPMVNPTEMGYNNWVVLLIKAEPDKLKSLAVELSALNMTWTVSLITGQWQIYAVALFTDSAQTTDFIVRTLSALPGITEFEVIPIGNYVKYTFPSQGPGLS